MVERLDEERLEILRSWGAGLALDGREELRAAGKAIQVLIEEIDRLEIDLWNARADRGASGRETSTGSLVETLAERTSALRVATPDSPRL